MGCCASAPPKHGGSREGVYEKPAEPAVATHDGTEKPPSISTGEEANPGQKLDWEQHAVADLTPEMREAELAALQEAQLRAMVEKGRANGIGSNSSLGAGAAGTTSGGETGTGHSAPVSLSRGTSSNSVCSSIHVLPELGAIPEDMEVTRKDSFESARSFVTTTSHLSAVAEVNAALHSTPADLPRVSPRSAPYSHSRFGLSGHSPRQAKGGKVLASGDDSYLPPDLPEDFEPFWMPMVGGLTDDPKAHTPAGMAPDRPTITIVRQSISSGSSIKMYEEGSKGQQPWEVREGLTQQETIAFCLSAPVNGLRCIKTVTKEDVKLRFTREVEMGSFSAGEHQFVFPTSPLPHGPLFRGTYSMRTTFADEAGEELFAVVCEFTLLPNPDAAGPAPRHGSHSDSGVAPSPHAAPGHAQAVAAGNGATNGRGPGPEPSQ